LKNNPLTIKPSCKFADSPAVRGYNLGSFQMALALKPNKENQIRLMTYFQTCRENLVRDYRSRVERCLLKTVENENVNVVVWRYVRHCYTIFDQGKIKEFRSATKENEINSFVRAFERQAIRSLSIINTIENELGWERSTIRKIHHSRGSRNFLYFVTGPKEWGFSPPLLSFYLLMIRSVGRYKEFEKVKSIAEFSKACSKDKNNFDDFECSIDTQFYKGFYGKIGVFLKRMAELYKDRNIKDNFSEENTTGPTWNIYHEGISQLMAGNSIDKEINKRLKKMIGH
jgi:hypothetical protein